MSDAENVKELLDGTVDPSELEEDSELYFLAERIYGKEALEQMGISAPVVPTAVFDESDYSNGNYNEVELPEEPDEEESPKTVSKPRRTKLPLLTGLVGLMIVSLNILMGIGSFIELCEDPPVDLPLEFNSKASHQGDILHVTWTISNMDPSLGYSVEWVISENGSQTMVDTNSFNWTSQNTYIHIESRMIDVSPWCYISTLYENQTEIAVSNECEGQVSIETMSETTSDNGQCEDNPRLVWSQAREYENLDSWAPAGSGDLLDGALLMLFVIIALSGLRRKSPS